MSATRLIQAIKDANTNEGLDENPKQKLEDLLKELKSVKDFDINQADATGWTALHYAVASKNDPQVVIRLLLEAGADPEIKIQEQEEEGEERKPLCNLLQFAVRHAQLERLHVISELISRFPLQLRGRDNSQRILEEWNKNTDISEKDKRVGEDEVLLKPLAVINAPVREYERNPSNLFHVIDLGYRLSRSGEIKQELLDLLLDAIQQVDTQRWLRVETKEPEKIDYTRALSFAVSGSYSVDIAKRILSAAEESKIAINLNAKVNVKYNGEKPEWVPLFEAAILKSNKETVELLVEKFPVLSEKYARSPQKLRDLLNRGHYLKHAKEEDKEAIISRVLEISQQEEKNMLSEHVKNLEEQLSAFMSEESDKSYKNEEEKEQKTNRLGRLAEQCQQFLPLVEKDVELCDRLLMISGKSWFRKYELDSIKNIKFLGAACLCFSSITKPQNLSASNKLSLGKVFQLIDIDPFISVGFSGRNRLSLDQQALKLLSDLEEKRAGKLLAMCEKMEKLYRVTVPVESKIPDRVAALNQLLAGKIRTLPEIEWGEFNNGMNEFLHELNAKGLFGDVSSPLYKCIAKVASLKSETERGVDHKGNSVNYQKMLSMISNEIRQFIAKLLGEASKITPLYAEKNRKDADVLLRLLKTVPQIHPTLELQEEAKRTAVLKPLSPS